MSSAATVPTTSTPSTSSAAEGPMSSSVSDTPANDKRDLPFIGPLYKLIGTKAHCYLGFGMSLLVVVCFHVLFFFRKLLGLSIPSDDYKGLTGFNAFYMKNLYGPVSDCFSRPIKGAPGKFIDVIERKRIVQNRIKVSLEVPDLAKPKVQRCLNLGSYNYLGYGGPDDKITPSVIETLGNSGITTCGTEAEAGISEEQRQVERLIAEFVGKDAAISLPMGFATNSMFIPGLISKGCLAISDSLNHSSIVTGIRMSGATVRVWNHGDIAHLEKLLKVATGPAEGKAKWKRILIVAEGIYSMEGEVCPLPQLVQLKKRYGAMLYVDEAHSIGALGPYGKGICDYFGVDPKDVDILMGTFTKSFSSVGGYVASDAHTIAHLRKTAIGPIYGWGMSPPCARQIIEVITELKTERGLSRCKQLRENSILFRKTLTEAGCDVLGPPDTPVIPVMIPHMSKVVGFSRNCLKHNIATVIVGYPATPMTEMRSRFCMNASLSTEEVKELGEKVCEIAKEQSAIFVEPKEAKAKAIENEAILATKAKPEVALPLAEANQTCTYQSEPFAPAAETNDEETGVRLHSRMAACKVNLSTFDFLGLANSDHAKQLAAETLEEYGCGSCGPRGFYGTTDKHIEVERRIARWMGTESAIVYSYGVLTASSVIAANANPEDILLYDSQVNFNIQTGIGLTKAKAMPFAHNDMAALEKILRVVSKSKEMRQGRRFIVTEGIFANSGEICPIPRLVELKEKYDCILIVDETLSLGSLGATGHGIREHWAETLRAQGAAESLCQKLLSPETVDLTIGSLETCFGSIGGFCAGPKSFISFQCLSGTGYVFSASTPPYLCSAAIAALDLLEQDPKNTRQATLRTNIKSVRDSAFKLLGDCYDVSGDDSSPMMLLTPRKSSGIKGADKLQALCDSLVSSRQVGISVARFGERDISSPANPALRICVSARYTPADYQESLSALRKLSMVQSS